LARRLAAVYVAELAPRAILLTGSAAAGESDYYSDIDMMVYCDQRPSIEQKEAARERIVREIGATPLEGRNRDNFSFHGVECQVGHTTVALGERWLAQVLDEHDPNASQKIITGILQGIPLHGEALLRAWQARAAVYPEPLALVTVKRYLQFLPVWRGVDYFAARDGRLWFHQVVVESAQNVLGVLAGLNWQYYSTFQFKRMRQFVDTLALAPPDLADRIERTLAAANDRPADAASEIETLVAETVALVETHMPEVDTSAIRRDLGARFQPWQPVPL